MAINVGGRRNFCRFSSIGLFIICSSGQLVISSEVRAEGIPSFAREWSHVVHHGFGIQFYLCQMLTGLFCSLINIQEWRSYALHRSVPADT